MGTMKKQIHFDTTNNKNSTRQPYNQCALSIVSPIKKIKNISLKTMELPLILPAISVVDNSQQIIPLDLTVSLPNYQCLDNSLQITQYNPNFGITNNFSNQTIHLITSYPVYAIDTSQVTGTYTKDATLSYGYTQLNLFTKSQFIVTTTDSSSAIRTYTFPIQLSPSDFINPSISVNILAGIVSNKIASYIDLYPQFCFFTTVLNSVGSTNNMISNLSYYITDPSASTIDSYKISGDLGIFLGATSQDSNQKIITNYESGTINLTLSNPLSQYPIELIADNLIFTISYGEGNTETITVPFQASTIVNSSLLISTIKNTVNTFMTNNSFSKYSLSVLIVNNCLSFVLSNNDIYRTVPTAFSITGFSDQLGGNGNEQYTYNFGNLSVVIRDTFLNQVQSTSQTVTTQKSESVSLNITNLKSIYDCTTTSINSNVSNQERPIKALLKDCNDKITMSGSTTANFSNAKLIFAYNQNNGYVSHQFSFTNSSVSNCSLLVKVSSNDVFSILGNNGSDFTMTTSSNTFPFTVQYNSTPIENVYQDIDNTITLTTLTNGPQSYDTFTTNLNRSFSNYISILPSSPWISNLYTTNSLGNYGFTLNYNTNSVNGTTFSFKLNGMGTNLIRFRFPLNYFDFLGFNGTDVSSVDESNSILTAFNNIKNQVLSYTQTVKTITLTKNRRFLTIKDLLDYINNAINVSNVFINRRAYLSFIDPTTIQTKVRLNYTSITNDPYESIYDYIVLDTNNLTLKALGLTNVTINPPSNSSTNQGYSFQNIPVATSVLSQYTYHYDIPIPNTSLSYGDMTLLIQGINDGIQSYISNYAYENSQNDYFTTGYLNPKPSIPPTFETVNHSDFEPATITPNTSTQSCSLYPRNGNNNFKDDVIQNFKVFFSIDSTTNKVVCNFDVPSNNTMYYNLFSNTGANIQPNYIKLNPSNLL